MLGIRGTQISLVFLSYLRNLRPYLLLELKRVSPKKFRTASTDTENET
jgi:hypothetical protein